MQAKESSLTEFAAQGRNLAHVIFFPTSHVRILLLQSLSDTNEMLLLVDLRFLRLVTLTLTGTSGMRFAPVSFPSNTVWTI